MRRVAATVVRVTGTCNAGYRVGDKIVINRDRAIEKAIKHLKPRDVVCNQSI